MGHPNVTPSHSNSEDPAKLRGMFGRNLQILSAPYPSISALCRELEINRTQFNRYLAGESFPRPDILHRICNFFDVDARILLEPVEALTTTASDLLNHPELEGFSGASRWISRKASFQADSINSFAAASSTIHASCLG